MNKRCRSVISHESFSRRCKNVEGHSVKLVRDHNFKAHDRFLHEAGSFMWDSEGNEIGGGLYVVSLGEEQVVPWLKSDAEIDLEVK